VQQDDLSYAIKFITQERDIAEWYGYQYMPSEDGGLDRVVIPNPQRLNERKNSLPSEIGVNRGSFIDQEGGRFGRVEYLKMLGREEVPIASDPGQKAHDLCAHTGGFGVMSAETFTFLSWIARDALVRDDSFGEDHRKDVTGAIDDLSAWLTKHTIDDEHITREIGMLRSLWNAKDPQLRELVDSREKVADLMDSLDQSQIRTLAAFREYAREQNALGL
jgi:hypothetical protein